jgi:type I restriction enzyme R subunit
LSWLDAAGLVRTPEAQAREQIDERLQLAGWVVQDRAGLNLGATRGVAIREFPLQTGFADYLLFVDRKAIGAIEAKAVGTPLRGVEPQAAKYGDGLRDDLPAWRKPLPFLYESTGAETLFTDGRDPQPRSRRVFAFHRPETLAEWAQQATSFRARLRELPPLVTTGLWDAQVEAIENLDKSLADDRPRALIQMATGSGKTFTAVSFIYRLIKFGGARRVLFLVDRSNLGRQTLKEFQQYVTPDDGRKFTELYNVQRLTSNAIDPVSRVCITTIQRLYATLAGQSELDPSLEERSMFDLGDALGQEPRSVDYCPKAPIETFDVIVTDECHRSIYHLWRQVLEYFDAHLIGLTATPSKQTFGFFNQNLVMEYSRARAVAEGINVDGQVYRIRTAITERGSSVDAGYYVDKRDRLTRQLRWEQLDDDLVYDASALDRQVVSEDQIRTVIREFRRRLFIELFPERREVPKTLIFAKDDSHAEDIVQIVREEFARGNDFCQKITYRVSGVNPEDLIASFRNSYNPRIAVTVDMIATGTDVKPLEVLLFLRPVKSRILFEQMVGRGTRVIDPTDLQAVTPDARRKERFVIVDAVGVVDQPKIDLQPLERQPTVAFDKLIEAVAMGKRDEDTLTSLARRLGLLERKLTDADRYAIAAATGGQTVRSLASALIEALDPDRQVSEARSATGTANPTPEQIAQATTALIDRAVAPFDNPVLRQSLVDIRKRDEQTIDRVSQDRVLEAGFDDSATGRARSTVESFKKFVETNRDEITALQLIYSQPYGQRRPTFQQIRDLANRLKQPPLGLTADELWLAYAQLDRDRVRGVQEQRVLADLISLVRHAVGAEQDLVPYPDLVRARFDAWLAAQTANGRAFTPDQRWWLDRIAEHVGVNLTIEPADLDTGPFYAKGGRFGAVRSFGKDLPELLAELNQVLAA